MFTAGKGGGGRESSGSAWRGGGGQPSESFARCLSPTRACNGARRRGALAPPLGRALRRGIRAARLRAAAARTGRARRGGRARLCKRCARALQPCALEAPRGRLRARNAAVGTERLHAAVDEYTRHALKVLACNHTRWYAFRGRRREQMSRCARVVLSSRRGVCRAGFCAVPLLQAP